MPVGPNSTIADFVQFCSLKMVKIIDQATRQSGLIPGNIPRSNTQPLVARPRFMTRTSQTYTRDTSPQPQLPSRLVRLLSEAKWLVLTVLTTYLVLILLTYAKA